MQDAADRRQTPTAIPTNLCAIFVSLELSRSTWLITSLSPAAGEKMFEAFDALWRCSRATGALRPAQGESAGTDGTAVSDHRDPGGRPRRVLGIDRVLQKEGIESHIVDPASIATSRRRRAKTDKIDGESLIRALVAYKRGEPHVCAMVRVRKPEHRR
jgi:transposase